MIQPTKQQNPFDQFTNLYSLSKTLRFELKPVGKTEEMLKENNVFAIDEERKKAYEKIKPYFNRLHREFIDEALVNVDLDGLKNYFKALQELKKDRRDQLVQKQIERLRKSLRDQIAEYFDQKGQEWATEKYSHLEIKKDGLDILFEEEVFQILKDRYGNEKETKLTSPKTEEIVSIFDGWKGFTGYFTKFFETRRNFYKNDGTFTARIIDRNLDRFLDNIITYNSIKEKINVAEVEKFFSIKTDEVFSVEFYNKCLLQAGIDKYNDFLGGKTTNSGKKIHGINEIINKYKQDNAGEKLSFLKKLDKQILSEQENFIDEIENPIGLFKVLTQFHESAQNKTQLLKVLFTEFIQHNQQFDLKGVCIDKKVFDPYSSRWIAIDFTEEFQKKLSNVIKHDGYKLGDFIPLYYVRKALEEFPEDIQLWKHGYYIEIGKDDNEGILSGKEAIWEQFLKIFEFEFFSHFERTVMDIDFGKEHKEGYNIFEQNLKRLLNDFKIDKDSKVVIKNFADEVMYIYRMAKYFALEKKRSWVDEGYDLDSQFYNHIDYGFKDQFYENAYEKIVQPYNKIRNYLTRKPYSQEKWKLNFNKSKLLEGWPDSPEGTTQYCSFVFRKSGRYFLGITDYPRILDEIRVPEVYRDVGSDPYEKMVYKQIDAKTIYGSTYIGLYGSKYSDDQNELDDTELIVRIKTILESKSKIFPELKKILDKLNNGEFKDAKSLARAISEGSFYNVSFRSVLSDYIEKGIYEIPTDKNGNVDNKKLYLFEIHNKDWNLKDGSKKAGSKNLHTLYFEELFSQTNEDNNFPFKLNGQAEIFYRPKTEKENLGIKLDQNKKEVPNHKRYSENKIFFHVPITLNRVSKNIYRFNTQINDLLANNSNINIIGIDRGEKHIAYYSVINQKGEILLNEQGEKISGSLNLVGKDSEGKPIDYHKKLEEKSAQRKKAREDWQDIEGIKDLKKGYISQVVRKLADLAVKHNAIIAMEDLNMRFKQIRGGVEKSAYQQLEKALIEKLNFLVDKNEVDPSKTGHLLKAYQLTAPFDTFKDMGKQTGIIFYTQAAYTSKIDPLTGWRPNIYLKYLNATNSKKDILKFKDIRFDKEKRGFEFTYDIKDFTNAKEFPNKTKWIVYSNIERFRWDRNLNSNKGGYTHYKNLTEEFKVLFGEFGIDIYADIKDQINDLDSEKKENVKLFRDFIFYFNLICQIRNTQQDKEGNENDFLLSPVEPFFDSRKSNIYGKNLPTNGDENGAYNIARKGILILNKISEFSNKNQGTKNIKWGDLYISTAEWDNFAARDLQLE